MTTSKKLKALFAGAFAVALCFALAGCGSSSSSSATSASSSASAASESASSASESASASAASDAEKPAASSAGSSAASASEASKSSAAETKASSDTVDQYGNVTLYALLELTGPELTALMESQEYEWGAGYDDPVWKRIYDGATVAAVNKNGAWEQDAYAKATDKGAVASTVGMNVVGGYKDSQAALSGNAKCVIEDSFFNDDGTGIAIVYGPSMEEHLVLIKPAGESTTELDIYSKAAVGSGLLDNIVGRPMGGSFEEVWKTVTGKDTYGH